MYIGYDVTEQKRIEEERKIIDRDLARYEKSMALTDMAAGIAHEINSPTAVILNDLQLLKLLAAEADDTNEKKKQKIISIINRDIETANRISSIVKAMKHSYRPGFWKTIDIISEIELQLTLLSKQMKGRVSIVRKYNMTAPVNSYGSEVGQVILNLLANAVESISGEGVIEIRVFEEEEGHVNVQIKDSGSGIPDEIASHIFEPFYTTKGEYGTGLGLSTSKAIMKKHNGSLELTKSLPGKGSIFTLILPIAKEVPHDL
jgi:two-component system NtrC family sensor kinase